MQHFLVIRAAGRVVSSQPPYGVGSYIHQGRALCCQPPLLTGLRIHITTKSLTDMCCHQAMARLVKNDVHFRFVIDIQGTLSASSPEIEDADP
jgi:hypothetical protein